MTNRPPLRVSIVIPVYAGERSLPALMADIEPLTRPQTTPCGHDFVVGEVLLVHDCGSDRSDQTVLNGRPNRN